MIYNACPQEGCTPETGRVVALRTGLDKVGSSEFEVVVSETNPKQEELASRAPPPARKPRLRVAFLAASDHTPARARSGRTSVSRLLVAAE